MNINYPNMSPEIIEAILNHFKNDEDIIVDCLLYLSNLRDNKINCEKLSYSSMSELEKMNRCMICGNELQIYKYEEPHPELDGCPMEIMSEPYCPNCDI